MPLARIITRLQWQLPEGHAHHSAIGAIVALPDTTQSDLNLEFDAQNWALRIQRAASGSAQTCRTYLSHRVRPGTLHRKQEFS